jgi:uncharacterized delta-60 repeat protein
MRRSIARTVLLTLCLACAVAGVATAVASAAGLKVDRSFGTGGTVAPHFGPAYYQGAITSIAPATDGTILAGRTEAGETIERFERLDAAGRPLGGPVPESRTPRPEAVEPDGRVVQLAAVDFQVEAIAVAPSGEILAAGTKFHNVLEGAPPEPEQEIEQLCVARFEPSGALDPSFGQGGVVHLRSDLGFEGEDPVGLVARPGGGAVLIDRDTVRPPGVLAYATPGSYLVGQTATGALDPGYGGGEVRLAADLTAFAPAPGGGLLVAGDEWGAPVEGGGIHESDFFLARYGDDGRPDPGFAGGAGSRTVDFGGIDLLRSLLVEADGSILLGGAGTAATSSCVQLQHFCTETPVLARFTAAGEPDPSFGTDGQLKLTPLTEPYVGIEGEGVEALAVRPGGGVLVGGGSGRYAFLGALTAGGALDPGFAEGGLRTLAMAHASRSGAHAAAVDRQGRIVIGGGTDASLPTAGPEGAVFRLLPNGALDPGFGDGEGFARVPGEANEIALAGASTYVLSFHEPLLSRLDATGHLDPSFGQEGTEKVALGRAVVDSLATAPGGGALLAGTTASGNSRAVVGRIASNGAPARSFGHAGIATLGFGYRHRCGAEAIAVQPDGRVLVAGFVEAEAAGGPHKRLAVMRLLANGKIDRTFGRRGVVTLAFGRESLATAIAVAPGGDLLVGGRSRTGKTTRELLVRLTRSGHLDRAFAKHGVSATPPPREANGRPARNAFPTQILIGPHGPFVLHSGAGAAALQANHLILVRDRRGPEEGFRVQRLLLSGAGRRSGS